jgi:hypothetical protein
LFKGNIGVDENLFIESFENVPRIQIYSAKEVEQHMQQINDCIGNPSQDWEKRVDSVSCCFYREGVLLIYFNFLLLFLCID